MDNNQIQSGALVQSFVQNELLNKLRTNNPIIDTIICFMIFNSQDAIIKYISQLKNLFIKLPFVFIALIRKIRKNPYNFIDKETQIKYITDSKDINTLFEPIQWYVLSTIDKKNESSTELYTTKNNKYITQALPENILSKFTFLDHEIICSLRKELITIYTEKEHKRENVIITLKTKIDKNRNVDIFEQFAEMCIKKYDEYKSKQLWTQQIYRNDNNAWKGKPSKTSRKINTIILKDNQMDDIVNDIKSFVQKEDWYVSRDIPYTRRYMFYGTPGTGKSSCIKALACLTKRHIHYLVLSEVDSDSSLFKLFETINFNETILVIEDIDCASNVTHSRVDDVDNKEDRKKEDGKKEDDNKTRSLTLSGLLNAIDGGIIDNHGQIMIVTTNHPEKLDDALVRPGRIDRKYDFSNCDTQQIEGIFYNFFEKNIPSKTQFINGCCSPAEVTSLFLQYKKNPDDAWNQIVQKYAIEA